MNKNPLQAHSERGRENGRYLGGIYCQLIGRTRISELMAVQRDFLNRAILMASSAKGVGFYYQLTSECPIGREYAPFSRGIPDYRAASFGAFDLRSGLVGLVPHLLPVLLGGISWDKRGPTSACASGIVGHILYGARTALVFFFSGATIRCLAPGGPTCRPREKRARGQSALQRTPVVV